MNFEELTPVAGPAAAGAADLGRLRDVPVELAVEIGRTRMTIGEALALCPGSIVTLGRMAGEPVDLLVNGSPIARGEVVAIDEELGLRITEILSPTPELSVVPTVAPAEPEPVELAPPADGVA